MDKNVYVVSTNVVEKQYRVVVVVDKNYDDGSYSALSIRIITNIVVSFNQNSCDSAPMNVVLTLHYCRG